MTQCPLGAAAVRNARDTEAALMVIPRSCSTPESMWHALPARDSAMTPPRASSASVRVVFPASTCAITTTLRTSRACSINRASSSVEMASAVILVVGGGAFSTAFATAAFAFSSAAVAAATTTEHSAASARTARWAAAHASFCCTRRRSFRAADSAVTAARLNELSVDSAAARFVSPAALERTRTYSAWRLLAVRDACAHRCSAPRLTRPLRSAAQTSRLTFGSSPIRALHTRSTSRRLAAASSSFRCCFRARSSSTCFIRSCSSSRRTSCSSWCTHGISLRPVLCELRMSEAAPPSCCLLFY
eukprot:Hpha_TRINITY_DN16534_c1_g3::TRINITY_DN16534_c1_g3_i1::g.133568::m.133568